MNGHKVVEPIRVTLCLGSSCFSRGSRTAVQLVQEYVRRNGLEERVLLEGSLCQDGCRKGPNVTIDGTAYHKVDPTAVVDLLEYHLAKNETESES